MNIGVVGLGVVGGAVYEGFKQLDHKVSSHDIKHNTTILDVVNTEICFICVPTPSKESGQCNTSIVESVVQNLSVLNYKGIIAVKSTVTPGTVNRLKKAYSNLTICFVPEFLRERCAVEDFIENHDLCVIGADEVEHFEKIKECHGHYPNQFIHLPPLEAELIKYFNNIYNATLVTFANSFYEVCSALGADYSKVKNTIVEREHINDVYLNCNESFRGFGGPCLPKDTKAIAHLAEKMNIDVQFFETLLKENSKYKITVYDGMREE